MKMEPTTQKGFRTQIRARMEQLNIYRREFEMPVRRLADVYWRRAKVEEKLTETDFQFFMTVTNAKGDLEVVKNPYLIEIEKLDKQAMELERELGLTPNSLKRINEAAMPNNKAAEEDPLAAALGSMRLLGSA